MGVAVTRTIRYNRKGVGISYTDVEYADSTSNSVAPTTGWQTAAPAWQNGHYIWTRTHIVYTDGTDQYSNPVCIPSGKGIASIVEQYYQSTSATELVGGQWVDNTAPAWVSGKYIWTRSKITYTDGTAQYTDAINPTGQKGDKGDNAVTYSISLAGSVFYRDPNTETIYVDIKGKVYRNAGGNTYAQSLNRTDLSLYFLKDDDTQDAVPNVNNIDSGYTVSGSTFATKFYNGTGYAGEKAFVAVLSIDGVERVRESIQITKNGERGSNGGTGSQGPRGYRGPGLRGPQDWNQMEAGYQFYKGDESNQEPYEDFVVYNGYYYKCIKTHTKAASRYPYSGSEYWVLSDKLAMIAANVLFAKHGYFGSAIISGDWLISTNGMVDNTFYNNGATYNGIIAYSLFNENNPSGDPITKFSGSGPYTLAASDTTKNIGTVTLEEGKTYKLTATGKCGSSSGSYYIRLRYGSNGATNTPVMINGTSDVTRSGVFTANASGTYYIEFYNTSGLTGTVTNVVLAEMNFAPVFALDLLTGKTYQNDAVIKGSIYRPPLIVNDSNYTTYAPKNYAGCYIVDISKTGLNVQLNFEVNSGTLLIDFPSASLYQGAELTVMNCSNVTAYVESVLWGAGDASFPIKQGGGYAVFKSTKYSNNNWIWFPIAEIHDPYYD